MATHYFMATHHPLPIKPFRGACGIDWLVNKAIKKDGILASYPLKSPSTEWSWMNVH